MAEVPVYTTPKTPVLEPNLFLLNHANRPFVGRHNEYIVLENPLGNMTIVVILSMGIVGVVTGMALMGILNLPSAYNALAFFVPLVDGIIAIVSLLRYLNHDVHVQGQMIPGVVIHAEKIRVPKGRASVQEYLGVRYQFAVLGEDIEGSEEGDFENASYGRVPAPGTPIRNLV